MTTLHYLVSLYMCQFGQSGFSSLVVNHSIINMDSCILTDVLPHSGYLRFGLSTLTYENTENHYLRHTISPKIDPLAYVCPIQKA